MPTVSARCSITGITPVQSKAKSTVEPVIFADLARRGRVERELIVCVAPNSCAISRRLSWTSAAMIFVTPELRAAMIAASPTAPTPTMSTESPSRGRASLSTAPAPVARPQARGPRSSSGASPGTFTSASAVVIEWVAKDDWPKKWPLMRLAVPRVRGGAGSLALEPPPRHQRLAGAQAVARLPVEAVAALPARRPSDDHFVARRDLRHALADLLHDAGALVSEHGRERHRHVPARVICVRVADAGGDDAHQHLPAAGLLELDLLLLERGVLLLHYQGADRHRRASSSAPRSAVLEHRPGDHLRVGRRRVLEAVELPVLRTQGVGGLARDGGEEVGQERRCGRSPTGRRTR